MKKVSYSSYAWSRVTSFLHALMALTVIFQVVMILFREWVSREGSWAVYRQAAITLHKDVGIAVFFIVLAFFIWKIISGGKASFLQFYPVTQAAWRKVIEDFQSLLHAKLPVRQAKNSLGGLSGLVQGLGLLLVLALSGLGTLAMLSWYDLLGVPASWGAEMIHLHKFFAGLIWWYLGGHIGMAILHQWVPPKFQKEL